MKIVKLSGTFADAKPGDRQKVAQADIVINAQGWVIKDRDSARQRFATEEELREAETIG